MDVYAFGFVALKNFTESRFTEYSYEIPSIFLKTSEERNLSEKQIVFQTGSFVIRTKTS